VSGQVARLRDILQLRFTDLFAGMPASVLSSISPASPLKRLARVAGYAGLRLVGHLFQPIKNADNLRGAVWLYVVSANNYDALSFIKDARPDAVLVAGQGKNIGRYGRAVNRLSLRRKILYYWQYPAALLGLKGEVGGRALRFFDLVFYALGYYEVYRRALRHYRPQAVVFANDHNDDARALLLACRAEGVPTAYVQHASVSTNFPPLGFDLSLLEGQDALDKYRQCGPVRGRVELVGMPKADAFLAQRNTAPQVRRVAVACNLLDELPALAETLAYLMRELPALTFTLRPHPGDRRDFGALRQALPGLQWSDPHQENVFQFLQAHDALVAADTSTHLEATLLNVASVYYRFSPTPTLADYYGYAAHGLSEWAHSLPELAATLGRLAQHKPLDLYRRAAYYNATLGTPDEGHSRALAVRRLGEWLQVLRGQGLMAEIRAQVGPLRAGTSDNLSAEDRLAYVWRHFTLAYPEAPTVSVGYSTNQPQVEIAEVGADFFGSGEPYPAAPNWREWQGRQIPFFFDSSPEKQLLTLQSGKAFIAADIISAAFYLLSGWQEYFSNERDRHGRFSYAASVQHKYGFVALPVVNYYFDMLRVAVEHVSRQPLRPRRWGPQQAEFAAFISHDVDNLHSGWKAPAKAALQQRQFGRFGKLLWQHLTQRDAWDNLETVAAATAQYGAESTFFLLPVKGRAANGTPNADYELAPGAKLWQRLPTNCTLELHGSIGTSTNVRMLTDENENIMDALGVRFHYLSWEPIETPTVVSDANFNYDATLGFAEHYGFRNSYCLPFYPFNFEWGAAADFLEIPLNVMDTTLHHPNYLQLAPAEILPALAPVFAEIKRFGGVASVLWHNENFDPANTRNGPRQFHEIMAHLQAAGAAFRTGREIWEEFTAEPAAETQNS
jgi:hypothetical protein